VLENQVLQRKAGGEGTTLPQTTKPRKVNPTKQANKGLIGAKNI